MTLSHKPLSELQALRAEVEAAIAAKGVTLENELTSVFKELHWAFTDWQVKRVADHLKRTALQRLAPAEPVDDEIKPFPYTPGPVLVNAVPVDDAWIERTARECAATAEREYLLTYGPQMVFKAAELAIRATLARGARWPGEAESARLIALAVDALEEARDVFAEYARMHQAKLTDEGNAKARRNLAHCDHMNRALSALRAQAPADGEKE